MSCRPVLWVALAISLILHEAGATPLNERFSNKGQEWTSIENEDDLAKVTRDTKFLSCVADSPRLLGLVAEKKWLRGLSLTGDMFGEGNALAVLSKLTELESLHVYAQNFDDTKHEWLASLSKLHTLVLDGSSVPSRAIFETLKACKNLKALSLIGCTGLEPEAINDVVQLKLRALRISVFEGPQVNQSKAIAGMGELEELTLEGIFVRDASMENLATCGSLRRLAITDGGITKAGLAHFVKCQELVELALTDCSSLKKGALSGLPVLTKLNTVSVVGCDGLDANDLLDLLKLTGLQYLELARSACDDALLAKLTTHAGVSHLGLSECKAITGEGVAALAKLGKLASLDLSSCEQLKREDFLTLGKIKSLRRLDVSGLESVDAESLRALAAAGGLLHIKAVGCALLSEDVATEFRRKFPKVALQIK